MKITYINLLNAFHANQLPAQVGPLETSLFKGLLHLANQLGFKQEWLKFPNSSVQNASGIVAPATFFRARKSLISFKFNGDYLVKYKKPKNNRNCGEYWICYDSLLDTLPNWSQNDNNLIAKPKRNRTESDSETELKPQTYIDKIREDQIRKEKKEEEAREFEFKIQDFSRAFANICPGSCNWTIRDHHKLLVDLANSYELEQIKPVIQEFWDAGSTRGELLSSVHAAMTGGRS